MRDPKTDPPRKTTMPEPYEHLEHFIELFQNASSLDDSFRALEGIKRLADAGHHGAALVFGQALSGRGICGELIAGPGEHDPKHYLELALKSPNSIDRRLAQEELDRLLGGKK